MSIAVIATKRAKGRLYVRVSLADEACDCRLEAQATQADGTTLPVTCAPEAEEGLWDVTLASLATTQLLQLSAVSWEGTTVEQLSVKLGPLAARLASPVQAMRSRAKGGWSLPSARAALGAWDVTVERLVATQGGQELCQGHACLVGQGRELVEGSVWVRALDAHGSDVSGDTVILLTDGIEPVAGYPSNFERRVEFSLRVPEQTPTLVVWVGSDDAPALPTGFACLGPRVTAGLREAWRSLATSAFDDDAYDAWYAGTHAASEAELSMQRGALPDLTASFSVVCVARTASPERLRATVEAVLAQTLGDFELVLVNAAPNNHKLTQAIRGMELADPRVRCIPLAADFGLAAATSEGVDAATGSHVCLVGEGDLLAPDALWCVARALRQVPDAALVYTDEDELRQDRHAHPLLKPDWDPDLQLCSGYVGGLICLRASLLADLETMGPEFDQAPWYRLVGHATRGGAAVAHVARVLYHRCAGPDEAASGATAVAGMLVAARTQLADTMPQVAPRASTRVAGCLELACELPDEPPLVSVIVLNRDHVERLDRCLASLRNHTNYPSYEVIIVENGSVEPETFAYYRAAEEADERLRTIYYQVDGSFDEARLVNFGVSRAAGELLCLLHNDVELTDDEWMARLVGLCLRPGTAAASARLVRADGTIECCGEALAPEGPLALGRYRLAADEQDRVLSLLHATSMVAGSCLVLRKDAFVKVGGMRREMGSCFAVEELCLRLRARGLRVVVDPQVSVVHHRPLAADAQVRDTVEWLQAVGRLWEAWPHAAAGYDPQLGPVADRRSPYRCLPD